MEYKEPIPKQDYKVLVRCFTFNHSKYIEDALNGFVMQKTNFPYVCVIVDDCSTDGEQEVIKNYLNKEFDMTKSENFETDYANIVTVSHKTNPNCTFVVYLLKYNHYSKKQKKGPYIQFWRDHCKYEAICEGDDYWIDPLKLQKQVAYLDEHSECGIVGSIKKSYIQKEGKFIKDPKTESQTDFNNALLKGRFNCGTCTIMYRMTAIEGYDECVAEERSNKKWKMGDFPLWLYIMSKYTAYRFEEPMAVYRVLSESASHSKSYEQVIAFRESASDIQTFFARRFSPELLKKVDSIRSRRLFHTAIEYNQKKDALKYAKFASFSFTDYFRFLRILIK